MRHPPQRISRSWRPEESRACSQSGAWSAAPRRSGRVTRTSRQFFFSVLPDASAMLSDWPTNDCAAHPPPPNKPTPPPNKLARPRTSAPVDGGQVLPREVARRDGGQGGLEDVVAAAARPPYQGRRSGLCRLGRLKETSAGLRAVCKNSANISRRGESVGALLCLLFPLFLCSSPGCP